MPLSDIAQITITSDTPGVTTAGFGTPLILSADATFTERVRTYTDMTGVLVDFGVNTATYLQAQALFSQNPRPVSVKVGRLAGKPIQSWDIDIGSAGILNSTKYQLQVIDVTGATQTAFFTTDSSATEAELWVGLAASFNGLTGPTVTAASADTNTHMTLIADAGGTWHGVACLTPDGLYDSGLYMSIIRNEADVSMAADLAAIAAADNDWYAIVCPFTSEAITDLIAAYAEANSKLFLCDNQDSATVTAASGGTDATDDLKDSAYARTAPIYHPDNAEWTAASWAGRCLPLDPGSETWMFKTLAGVANYPITATHQTHLESKNCNYYYNVAGINITKDGKVSSGSFIDFIRFRDWFQARLAERIFSRLASNSKIAYTDAGIAILEAEVRAQIKEGIAVGGIAPSPAPTVTAPKAADASSADRAARLMRNLKFTFTYAGAIHKVLVSGNISL